MNDAVKLLNHGLGVSGLVPRVVLDVVDVIVIASSVNFHHLKKQDEFFKFGLSSNSKHVLELNRSCI